MLARAAFADVTHSIKRVVSIAVRSHRDLETNRQIMQQRQRLTCYCFTFLLLATSVCGQLSPQASRLAENLGMLLGLPLDVDLPNTNSSAAPDFLVDVYNCWTALKGSKNRASCLPVHDAEDKDSLEDVNVVRSIQGAGMYVHGENSEYSTARGKHGAAYSSICSSC